jgi:hypothetical protein
VVTADELAALADAMGDNGPIAYPRCCPRPQMGRVRRAPSGPFSTSCGRRWKSLSTPPEAREGAW